MKFFLKESLNKSDKTAMLKSRLDTEEFLKRNGYKKLESKTVWATREKKYLKPVQLYLYFKNQIMIKKACKKLKAGDTLLIQYPLMNTVSNFDNFVLSLKKRGIKLVAICHDLESFRHTKGTISEKLYNRLYKMDRVSLKRFDKIIVLNENMSKMLENIGFSKKQLIPLYIFDYLEKDEVKIDLKKSNEFIVAGNLSKEKAGYLRKIGKIDVKFNFFGVGIAQDELSENSEYFGAFSPESLTGALKGSYGLVWDGDSIKTCSGDFGKYLKINNPHKVSMLISAKIPVVIWKETALAKFITENGLGWAIKSLEDLPDLVKSISEEEYNKPVKNLAKFSKRLKSGYYLSRALKEAEKDI